MTQNVVQERRAGESVFEFRYLREFVNSATVLGLSDDTAVWCNTTWTGNVVRLRTYARDPSGAVPPSKAQRAPAAPGVGGAEVSEKSTIVRQDSTGPEIRRRRWGRKVSVPTLTLGDVRALIARVEELGLPADKYVVQAEKARWSYGQRVHSISAAPIG